MRARLGTDVGRALEIVRNGGIIGFPTETVYGLAADADDRDAIARIFATKGRPSDHPLIVHIASAAHLPAWSDDLGVNATTLATMCWPGPLTLVVKRSARVIDAVTGGRDTVGVRVPAHSLAQELLTVFGGGLAAPSANRFGRVSPTNAQDVLDDLGIAVDYVLDGGPCQVGVESTIVDCTVDPPQVLRPGGLPPEDIRRLLTVDLADATGPSRAPGMMESHYAPSVPILLADSPEEAHRLVDEGDAVGENRMVFNRTDDLVQYARNLYSVFRTAEAHGVDCLVAVLPPAEGLGHAIRDRLRKAAAPRPSV